MGGWAGHGPCCSWIIRLLQIEEAQWSGYARTSPTSTSADATIATDTVGDEPSEVPPTAGNVADELLRGQVEASMPPVVNARIPPASGPGTSATDVVDGDPSGTPPATVLVADAFDCGRVEVVPLPIVPASITPTLVSAATTATPAYIVEDQPSEAPPAAVVVDDESPRSQVEDVPMPFVQARISLGSTSASVSAATTPTTANADVDVLGEAPPAAIANGDGESACSMVGDVPMSPVDARLPPTFTLTLPTSANTRNLLVRRLKMFLCQCSIHFYRTCC